MTKSNNLIYVSNAGVLLQINDKKILIDGLCNSDIAMYKSTPRQIYQQIVQGVPPFDNINLMLITHHHSDHFDADLTCKFLSHSQNTVVVSTSEVISGIKKILPNFNADNLIALNPSLHSSQGVTADGINIEVISMTHFGNEFSHVSNFAYLIRDRLSVLHVGDAATINENYRGLKLTEKNIDLMVAPFPYISLPSARQIIREYINPRRIAVVHLPRKEFDSDGWIDAAKKSYNRIHKDYIKTEFVEELGGVLSI